MKTLSKTNHFWCLVTYFGEMPIIQRFEGPDDFPIAHFKAHYLEEIVSGYDHMVNSLIFVDQKKWLASL